MGDVTKGAKIIEEAMSANVGMVTKCLLTTTHASVSKNLSILLIHARPCLESELVLIQVD